MRDAADPSPPYESPRLWRQQVQLARGHWRREEAAGSGRSAGWWESVTVTWSPAPAPERRAAVAQRALAAAADIIAPLLADVAVASAKRLLERRHPAHLIASPARPQLAARGLPRSDRSR
jgi:hypothetical protein